MYFPLQWEFSGHTKLAQQWAYLMFHSWAIRSSMNVEPYCLRDGEAYLGYQWQDFKYKTTPSR